LDLSIGQATLSRPSNCQSFQPKTKNANPKSQNYFGTVAQKGMVFLYRVLGIKEQKE
jgi:hypothetical protein